MGCALEDVVVDVVEVEVLVTVTVAVTGTVIVTSNGSFTLVIETTVEVCNVVWVTVTVPALL